MKAKEMGALRKENVLIRLRHRAFFPLRRLYAKDSPAPTVFLEERGIADLRRLNSRAGRWQAYA